MLLIQRLATFLFTPEASSRNSLKLKNPKLLFLRIMSGNLRPIRFGLNTFLLGIRRDNRFDFDAPPRRFLGRMAPASSARGSTSALRDGGQGAAAGSYVPVIVSIILLVLIVAAVGGGGFILARRLQSRLNISAASFSPTVSSLTDCFATGADCSVTEIRWPTTGSSEWSSPVQPDHVELAATEQAQRKAAWARFFTAHFDPRTHRRKQCISIPIPPRRSIVELVLQPEPSLNVASSHQLAFLFSLSKRTKRSDLDDAAGLAAVRAFDDHLLEKCCLLAEAATRDSTNTAPALACERCCAESVLECLCGSGALTSSSADGGCPCSKATVLAWSSKRHSAVASLRRKGSVQAVPRRQVIIRHGTGAYAIHGMEELSTLKQHAARNASKATGLSNLSVHLVFNGKPVYDEEDIFESSGL